MFPATFSVLGIKLLSFKSEDVDTSSGKSMLTSSFSSNSEPSTKTGGMSSSAMGTELDSLQERKLLSD